MIFIFSGAAVLVVGVVLGFCGIRFGVVGFLEPLSKYTRIDTGFPAASGNMEGGI